MAMNITSVSSNRNWLYRIFGGLSHPQAEAEAEHSESQQVVDGRQAFEDYWAREMSDPESRALFEQEEWKQRLWLRLVEERIDRGLTPKEMAKRMKTKPKEVTRFEDGDYDHTSLDILSRYATALGLTLRFSVVPLDAEPECKSA